jgi:hypothetical protein
MTSAERAARTIGVTGALLVIAGGALVLVAFRFLEWYDSPGRTDATSKITFSELHGSADQLAGAGAANAYFNWLAWLLLIALVLVGVAATMPIQPADALRVAGCVIGVVGVAATYFAVAQLHNAQVAAGGERHNAFYNSTWGLWLTFAGFAAGAVGALLGPRKATG